MTCKSRPFFTVILTAADYLQTKNMIQLLFGSESLQTLNSLQAISEKLSQGNKAVTKHKQSGHKQSADDNAWSAEKTKDLQDIDTLSAFSPTWAKLGTSIRRQPQLHNSATVRHTAAPVHNAYNLLFLFLFG